jgi:hypothetical protein
MYMETLRENGGSDGTRIVRPPTPHFLYPYRMRNLTVTLCLTIAVLLGSAGMASALPPCPSDQNRYYDNCFGTYTYATGHKYVGEFRNDKRNGQGTYTFPMVG